MSASELITAAERKELISDAKELWHPGPARDVVKLEHTLAEACRHLRELIQDTEHRNHDCGDANCPVAKARDFLQTVEGEK